MKDHGLSAGKSLIISNVISIQGLGSGVEDGCAHDCEHIWGHWDDFDGFSTLIFETVSLSKPRI